MSTLTHFYPGSADGCLFAESLTPAEDFVRAQVLNGVVPDGGAGALVAADLGKEISFRNAVVPQQVRYLEQKLCRTLCLVDEQVRMLGSRGRIENCREVHPRP